MELELRERDFNLWTEKIVQKLKNRDFKDMDWDNLIEEIEDMGASQKRALRSYYYKLVEHILKIKDWQTEKDRNALKWRVEISNFRLAFNDILEDSPSLKSYLQENNIDWFNKVLDNYQKNQLFIIKDTTAIPLVKMMDDNFFG